MNLVFDAITNCRYLEGKRRLDQLNQDELDIMISENPECRAKIDLLLQREAEVTALLSDIGDIENSDLSPDWLLGSVLFGITTHYKLAADGCITAGTLTDLPLFEQCAVIHEIDLFQTWMPFCSGSKLLKKVPPFSRDAVVSAYGADCLLEHNKILLIGQSDDAYLDAPWQSGWFHTKMRIPEFKAVIESTGPTSARTIMIARVDPMALLPQWIINIAIRNLAGVMLYYFQPPTHANASFLSHTRWFQEEVKRVASNASSAHALRMRSNPDFYTGWLLPKYRAYCNFRGWGPQTILALAVSTSSENNDSNENAASASYQASAEEKEVCPNPRE